MLTPQVIVGLGNPGVKYALTRHNLGFRVLDVLAQRFKASFSSCSFAKGVIAQAVYEDIPLTLFMPNTFMNRSGEVLRPLMAHAKSDYANMLVVCDDFNIILIISFCKNQVDHNCCQEVQKMTKCHFDNSTFTNLMSFNKCSKKSATMEQVA